MVQVYGLVSSAKRHSPDFTQWPPGRRTCSFISHLSSPGSIMPGCYFRRTKLFKHTSLHCPTRYPLTPRSRECTRKQSALPRSTTSEHIQRSPGSNPHSLAYTSHTLPPSHDAPHVVVEWHSQPISALAYCVPTHSTGYWYSWGFEKLTRILGIGRDAGRLSANRVASLVRSDWVRSSSTHMESSLIINNVSVKKCYAQAGLPGSLQPCAEALSCEDV